MQIRKRTIFDTPVIKPLIRWISLLILKSIGWKVVRDIPDTRKFILLAAPHTSNWDFVLVLLISFALNIKVYTMMKKEVLDWTCGSIFNWLGAIPVDRSRHGTMVEQVVRAFDRTENLVVVIAPEATRKKVKRWKTGFYHIAIGADIPIMLGFLDYRRKTGGIGRMIVPKGDMESEMIEIKAFYADITGKYSENMSR
ncbi:1-acyl-sn-glycerol-3-phosphate acyltransferase [Desulfococcaceae bacterium HSG9]|nr:1-acyl-sn-glycerol-3-phosphate acyltransferase [Desulfococcaceae bacterium HSG9]